MNIKPIKTEDDYHEALKDFLGSHWDDYIIPEGGFTSFNQFFIRKINKKSNCNCLGERLIP